MEMRVIFLVPEEIKLLDYCIHTQMASSSDCFTVWESFWIGYLVFIKGFSRTVTGNICQWDKNSWFEEIHMLALTGLSFPSARSKGRHQEHAYHFRKVSLHIHVVPKIYLLLLLIIIWSLVGESRKQDSGSALHIKCFLLDVESHFSLHTGWSGVICTEFLDMNHWVNFLYCYFMKDAWVAGVLCIVKSWLIGVLSAVLITVLC